MPLASQTFLLWGGSANHCTAASPYFTSKPWHTFTGCTFGQHFISTVTLCGKRKRPEMHKKKNCDCCEIICRADWAFRLLDCFWWCAAPLGGSRKLTEKTRLTLLIITVVQYFQHLTSSLTPSLWGDREMRREKPTHTRTPSNSCRLPCDAPRWGLRESRCCFCISFQHIASTLTRTWS